MQLFSQVVGLLLFFCGTVCYAERMHLPVGVYEEHYETFQKAVVAGKCPSARDYPIEGNQVLAELLLFCEAIALGGLDVEIELKPFPAYSRLLRQLDSPSLSALGFGVWRRDLEEGRFYVSSPIVAVGNFVKGVYVLPSNKLALKVRSRMEVQQLIALTNPSWRVDEEAIACIGSKTKNARTYVNMFPMVAAKRADYLLTTFPAGQNLSIRFYDVTLEPISGVKVVLKDSLHFAINKNYVGSKKVYAALEAGLKKLNANGTLKQIYERLGLSNPLVDTWKNIGCE